MIVTTMIGTSTKRSRKTISPRVVSATAGPVSQRSKGAAGYAASQSCISPISSGRGLPKESGK